MLRVSSLEVRYEKIVALKDINLEVRSKEIVTLIGANGAGKTTLMKAISGVLKPHEGEIRFFDDIINYLPAHKIVERGISMVQEGRGILMRMTVMENLEMGAYVRKDKEGIRKDLEEIYFKFPILKERKNQRAGTLSGGEQQMLAIGRALLAKPRLLLMDEPSLGLAPLIMNSIFEIISTLNREGVTIFLVEQNAKKALQIALRGYVLENGKIVLQGNCTDLRNNKLVQEAYLGKMKKVGLVEPVLGN